MAAGLITQNTLHLNTDIGVCQIELCVGDITQLQREDKVDVLVVSAFPGDYSATPTSLIGQLKIRLGVSVRNLSKDKAEDLRRQYYCWWSKPLPEHLSFKRLLCFEGGFGSHGTTTPPKVVGAVFRCLVPILNNQEGSVIMPLLSCGDQGYSKTVVLRQLLNAAVHWMKAGLPLRTLKIVLFSRNPQKEDKSMQPLFKFFQEFKAKTEELDKMKKVEEDDDAVLYDIYLSHCPDDHTIALQIKEFLQDKESIKIFHDVQQLNENESWQDDMYNTMVKCKRVVTLLSPGYLASEGCIEQYNIALCIGRRKHKEVLAPFFIDSVEYLPTYMGLVQYIDCRPKDIEKLKQASISIKQWVEANATKTAVSTEMEAIPIAPAVAHNYEVFISYSHQNKDDAVQMLTSLKTIDPGLHVFIDSSGLHTGASWQQSLYHAIDEATILVALLSTDYLKSKICKEEFSLALALHMDESRDFKLVSLLIEDIELPEWCQLPKPVDCTVKVARSNLFSNVAKGISVALSQGYFEDENELEKRLAHLTDGHISIENFTQNYRKVKFVIRKNFLSESLFFPGQQSKGQAGYSQGTTPKSIATDNEVAGVVALSFAEEDAGAGEALKCLLLKQCPNIKISLPRTNAISRLNDLDSAQVITILLSPAYLNSKELVEELNIALYRHRSTSHRVVYPIIVSPLPPKPSYVRLLPCEFAVMDSSWMLRALGGKNYERTDNLVKQNNIGADVASCLIDASDLIAQEMSNQDEHHEEHDQVLLNVLEVQSMWQQLLEKLRKEEGLDAGLKMSFGIEIVDKESSASNKESGHDHPVPEDQGKDGENVGIANNKKGTSQHDAGKSVSFHPHVGATSGSYDLARTEEKNSKSCCVV